MVEETYCVKNGFKHNATVVYGDTDSVFVVLKDGEESQYEKFGQQIAQNLNKYFSDYIRQNFGVTSYLDMEYEKYYERFFLPPSRRIEARNKSHSNPSQQVLGSKKRYVGMMLLNGEKKLVFTGMEYVRSDWTKLARRFQWQLYQRMFLDQPVEKWLSKYVRDLRSGAYDRDLAYRKKLTKDAKQYTKIKPPHVKAALKLLSKYPQSSPRYISYVMTADGPEPSEFMPHQIDYEHYVDKQLKPLADAVLPYIGTSFDQVINGEAQALLFDDRT